MVFKKTEPGITSAMPLQRDNDENISSPRAITGHAESKDAQDLAPVQKTETQDVVYPSGLILLFLLISVFVSMFLVALV